MKRYAFGTFLVDDANRRAFEICRDIAELRPVHPLPVVLLADQGCGKTHLLYSIVNRVRTSSARAGLAYITAHDFPDQVRALIDDPSRVERAQSAILLVDQLEQFDHLVEELEGVIRVFLDNKHYVVVGSSVHPGRLQNLTPGLRGIVEAGQIIPILPQSRGGQMSAGKTQVSTERAELSSAPHSVPAALQAEAIGGDLAASVVRVVSRDGSSTVTAPTVPRPSSAEPAPRDELVRQLETAKAYCESLKKELLAAQEELAEARSNAAENAVRTELEQTVTQLRVELAEAQARAEAATQEADEFRAAHAEYISAQEQIAGLREQIAGDQEANRALNRRVVQLDEARTALESRVRELEGQLVQARAEHERTRTEAGQLVARAETLLAQIEQNRLRFAQAEEEHQRQLQGLERILEERTASPETTRDVEIARAQARDALRQLDTLRTSSERERRVLEQALMETRQQLEAELSLATADMQHAMKARGEALAEAKRLKDALAAAEADRDGARKALSEIAGERDDLRRTVTRAYADRDEVLAAKGTAEAQATQLRTALERAEGEHHSRRIALTQAQTECEELRAVAAAAASEREEAREAAAHANRELEALRAEVARSREEVDGCVREMESLRREAADQVALANAHAGEVERKMSALQGTYDNLRVTSHVVGAELQTIREQMSAAAATLTRLADHLAASSAEPDEEAAENSSAAISPAPGSLAEDIAPEDLARPVIPEDELPEGDMPAAGEFPSANEPDEEDGESLVFGSLGPLDPLPPNQDQPDRPTASAPLQGLEFPENALGPLPNLTPLEDEADTAI